MALSARIATVFDHARWNGYVDRDPNASVYHRFEWGSILERTYRKRFVPLVVESAGRVAGVLPLVHLDRGPLAGDLVSLPYFGHGGAIAESDDAWHALV